MYKLSGYIELLHEQGSNNEVKHYVLVAKRRVKWYLINEGIFHFLKHFETPTTLDMVINQYSNALQLKSKKSQKTLDTQLQSFYKDLIKRQWIVPENKLEETILINTILKNKDEFLNYRIIKILGNKRLTDVYLVKDKKTNKPLVIKLLNKEKFSSKEKFDNYLPNFKAEYNFLKKFNSIFINKTYGLKTYKGHPFIILKYEKGLSVKNYVKSNRLSTKENIKLVLKILSAFAIIHKSEVFHGDIHFSNLLINKNQQPRIIDFGYSNEVIDIKNNLKDLRNGGVYGFIPPERTVRSLDHRFTRVEKFQSEVYQITLIIYYIFGKAFPFHAETWKALVDEKHAFDIKAFQPFLKRRMPLLVRNFIIKGLDKEPENRFDDAQDMLNQWKKIAKNL